MVGAGTGAVVVEVGAGAGAGATVGLEHPIKTRVAASTMNKDNKNSFFNFPP